MTTIEQRKDIYQRAVRDISNGMTTRKSVGMCWLIARICESIPISFGDCDPYYMSTYLPELHAQKPDRLWNPHESVWFKWGDDESRIKCLQAAIELCNQQLQHGQE